MTDEFTTRLRWQLREAAEREARRGAVGRAAADARVAIASEGALGAVALLLLAVVAVAAVGLLRGPHESAQPRRGPHLISHVRLIDSGGTMAPAFGAVWVADTANGAVLRIDPRSERVLARIRLGGQPQVTAGGGAVWAIRPGSRWLYRIDPRRDAVVARIAVGVGVSGVIAAGRDVWVGSTTTLQHVDLASGTVDRRLPIAESAGYQIADVVAAGGRLYVERGDGVVLTLDSHSGARLGSFRVPFVGFLAGLTPEGMVVIGDSEVAAVNPGSGRLRWRRPLGSNMDSGFVDGHSVWVHGTDPVRPQDRLWRLEAGRGELTGSVALPGFGASAGALVGDRIWLMSPGGTLEVISR